MDTECGPRFAISNYISTSRPDTEHTGGLCVQGVPDLGMMNQNLRPTGQVWEKPYDMESAVRFEQRPLHSPSWSDSCYSNLSTPSFWNTAAYPSPAVSAEQPAAVGHSTSWSASYSVPRIDNVFATADAQCDEPVTLATDSLAQPELMTRSASISNAYQADLAAYSEGAPLCMSMGTSSSVDHGLPYRTCAPVEEMTSVSYLAAPGFSSADTWLPASRLASPALAPIKQERDVSESPFEHVLPSNSSTVGRSSVRSPSSMGSDTSCRSDSRGEKRQRQYATQEKHNGQCNQCHRYFTRLGNLKAHLKKHAADRPRAHACAEQGCKHSFERLTDLRRHFESVHMDERKYHCSMCSRGFKRRDILARHERHGCEYLPSKRRNKAKVIKRQQ